MNLGTFLVLMSIMIHFVKELINKGLNLQKDKIQTGQ